MSRFLSLSLAILTGALCAAAQDRPDVASGAAQRNENVKVNLIDNNAVKEMLSRLGASLAPVDWPTPARNYYGVEFGKAPAELPFLSKPDAAGWNFTLSEALRNSVFNARTFFQVGPVQPSRSNAYGITAAGPVGDTFVTLETSLRQVRGMVNGNALVPGANERVPLAQDPAIRAIVSRMIAAWGAGLPNRPDIDPRMRNSNSPETIDDDREVLTLEHPFRKARLAARYQRTTSLIDSFEFVAGQNPETALRAHRANLTWEQPLAKGVLSLFAGFDRLHSLLTPDPNAFASRVRVGFSLEDLGPSSEFPIDRVRNAFRGGAQAVLPSGDHRWVAGMDFTRYQINGRESLNARGFYTFGANFGRSAVENVLLGTPTTYEVTMGSTDRGFRNLDANFYFGDTWKMSKRTQVNYGVRYNLRTAPSEVNGRTPIPYHCSCKDFSPIFGIARQLGSGTHDYGVVRANYSISYGEVFDATYQQARLNLPDVRSLYASNPDILNLLGGVDLQRSGAFVLSPELASPYAHQYSLLWERRVRKTWNVQLMYFGSRGFHLIDPIIGNRALPVTGIPLITATVQQRRPDQTHNDIVRIANGGASYLDAARLKVDLPTFRGLMVSASYTFSKAIDDGPSYISTGAQGDLIRGRSQSEFNVNADKKGLSDFDSPHTFLIQGVYDLPAPAWIGGLRKIVKGWQAAGGGLFRTGLPSTLYVGSDAPGFGNVDGSPGDRPNLVDPRVLGRTVGNPDTATLLLPRAAFDFIHPGEMRGNLGRNTFRKDGIRNVNVAVLRIWRLPLSNGHNRTLLFRAEAYNLINHPQFDEPQRNLSSPTFGRITNTLNDGRVFQFVVRLVL